MKVWQGFYATSFAIYADNSDENEICLMDVEPEITENLPPEEKQPFFAKQKRVGLRPVKRRRRVVILIFALLGIILMGVVAGALFGYNSGVRTRVDKYESQVALITTTQFQLAMQDQVDGRLEMARKRLEYIIQLDPQFPGATQSLSEVMLAIAMDPGSVDPVVPTVEVISAPGVTPTPDNRGAEELFIHSNQLLQAGEWATAIEVLGSLRKANQSYRTVEVDGMYYIALRQRALDKILKEGNLEGGLYDLALMERFGPLDSEAQNFRIWSRYYITGASFWKVDWAAVVNNFSQVYPSLPNLRDGSGWTAAERYRIALIRFGEQLVNAEQWCDAEYQFNLALSISPDIYLEPTATYVYNQCHPATETPEPPAAPPQATAAP